MRLLSMRCARLIIACTVLITLGHQQRLDATETHRSEALYKTFAADTIHKGMSILFIGVVNGDCLPDTIWGARGGSIDVPTYLPRVIVWGQYDKRSVRGRKDSIAHCKGHIPDHLKVPYTLLTYPAWNDLRGSLTTFRFNPEDTLSDMVIAIRGTVGDGADRRDTSRLLLVWGQSGLDTMRTIALADVGVVQIEPFAAMELRKGTEVNNEKRRDISGRKSYELHTVGFRERERDTTHPEHSIAGGNPAGVLRVYPNPTGIAAQVEGRSLPAGDYSVEIVAVNGEVSQHQEVTVEASGSLLQTLDVQQVPTGYYIVRLQQHGKPLGMFPIVITH